MSYTQTHLIACQLCPDVERMLQVEMVDPSNAEFQAKVAAMFDHFIEQHGLTDEQCKALKVRPTAFLDGANGWAQQHKQWIQPATDTTPERCVAGYCWTKERKKATRKR